ncbi:MAG: dimethylsulfonioproprionate lyase family protein [Thermodesulfobacteriota bacterium]
MSTVVVKKSDFLSGAPMEARPGVRDIKVIYPETGAPAKSLCVGIVEIEPGAHSPRHRHNCEEVYYVLEGKGYVQTQNGRHEFEAGDAVLNRENTWHSVFSTGQETVRLLVIGGIMFVPLWPRWPTDSPYELDPSDAGQ